MIPMAWSPPEGSSELSSSSSPALLEEPLCCLCLKIIQCFGLWMEEGAWEGLTHPGDGNTGELLQ